MTAHRDNHQAELFDFDGVVEDIEVYEVDADAWVEDPIDNAIGVINAPGAVIRIGGRDYPWRIQPNCKVCRSRSRELIENGIFAGRTYRAILNHLPQGHNLTADNIGDHVRNDHMPLTVTVRAALVRERADEMRKSVVDAQENIVDHIVLCRAVVLDAFQGMSEGRRASISDGLQAARLLAALEEYGGGGIDREAMTQTLVAYMRAVQQVMDPDQLEQFATILRNDPELRELQAQFTKRPVIEASVVDA